MQKNILIVLGSPRRKGNSAALAEQVRQGVQAKGALVDTVYLNGLNIKPCQGCEKCQQEGADGCVVDDDMTQLYPKLKASDAIVIASPIYWFNVSGQTKVFLDRLYAVGAGQNNIFAGKKFALLLAFADPDPFVSGAVNAIRSFQDICRYLNADIAGMVYGSAYEAGAIKKNEDVLKEAYVLGTNIVTSSDNP